MIPLPDSPAPSACAFSSGNSMKSRWKCENALYTAAFSFASILHNRRLEVYIPPVEYILFRRTRRRTRRKNNHEEVPCNPLCAGAVPDVCNGHGGGRKPSEVCVHVHRRRHGQPAGDCDPVLSGQHRKPGQQVPGSSGFVFHQVPVPRSGDHLRQLFLLPGLRFDRYVDGFRQEDALRRH